jgi:hypothetical protein
MIMRISSSSSRSRRRRRRWVPSSQPNSSRHHPRAAGRGLDQGYKRTSDITDFRESFSKHKGGLESEMKIFGKSAVHKIHFR